MTPPVFLPGAALVASLVLVAPAAAERAPIILAPEALSPGSVLAGSVTGDDSLHYRLSAQAGQVLSVDLHATGFAPDFLIRPAAGGEVLFSSALSGVAVADVALPQDGAYEIAVGLNRAIARKGKPVGFDLAVALTPADFADALAGGPDWWQVTGLGAGGAMAVQDGPGPRYGAKGQADDGDVAQNRGCRISLGERWCSVRLAGSGLQGWLPGAKLAETAPPAAPEMPAGGPKGNGWPFDATGTIPCATAAAAPTHACPFGVVRDGPGNAGVWVALGYGRERHFLFEGGKLVSSDASGPPKASHAGDLMKIEVEGERYEMPEAVIGGG